ncbi:MAG TPA: hypothetical protein VKG79_15505, partial [Bryobacteraceae bacterium]|nr:hypothetical protein [Bryobacteraceae bacterium]
EEDEDEDDEELPVLWDDVLWDDVLWGDVLWEEPVGWPAGGCGELEELLEPCARSKAAPQKYAARKPDLDGIISRFQ